jgi:hypothetical protein
MTKQKETKPVRNAARFKEPVVEEADYFGLLSSIKERIAKKKIACQTQSLVT